MHIEQGYHRAKEFRAEDLVGREMTITHYRMEGRYRCRVLRSGKLTGSGIWIVYSGARSWCMHVRYRVLKYAITDLI